MRKSIIVSKENDGDFTSVSDAVLSLNNDNTPIIVYVKSGIYKEKVSVTRPFVTLIGEGCENTVICFDDSALEVLKDGEKRGTFRTPTFFIDADDFTAKNITFENYAGHGCDVGQALAVYADGDRLFFDSCSFKGGQDTLFTAPLPPTAYEKNGFRGPKEFSPRKNGRHYYKNCYIEGDIDFIFGGATAYFERCEIFSKKTDKLLAAENPKDQKTYGYITAASTPEGLDYGYVFENCRLTSDCPPQSVYLGRPWRSYAKTVFLNCEMGAHIKREGWHDWGKLEAHKTVYFAEYKSVGEGSNGERASFSKQLDENEALKYSKDKVLAGWDIK